MADVIARGSDSLNLGIDNTSWWPYWDRDSLSISSNTISVGQADFFTQTNTKTAIQTNWPTNGVLPKGFSATIFRVRIAMVAAAGVDVTTLEENDVIDVANGCVFELYKNVTDLRLQAVVASLADPMSGIYTSSATTSQMTQPGSVGLGTLPDFGQIEVNSEEAISARILVHTAITTTTSSLTSITFQVTLDTKRWKSVS